MIKYFLLQKYISQQNFTDLVAVPAVVQLFGFFSTEADWPRWSGPNWSTRPPWTRPG